MKEFLHTCLLGLILGFTATAQSTYKTGMQQAFSLWESNQYKEAENLFERITEAEKKEWLPYYYASQIKIIKSFSMNNPIKKEEHLEQAQALLNKSRSIAGAENVEVMVLQAMLHTSRLTIDPGTYGMTLSPVISRIYKNASEKAPDNPRVILSKAEWDMGAAQFFGEDPKKYCEDLQTSLRLFSESDPEEQQFAPSWGEDRAKMLVARTCGSEG